NPNNGSFQLGIRNYELGMNSTVEIYNMLGEKIYSNTFNIQHSTFSINLGTKSPGVYMYRLVSESGSQIANGKFVIE
ncbi:MAG TPA: T9SS type A sorting domain-containing protein, partial [Bacteroidia bacterium]|nr:T9SS type A sorting domain-containing protein [Bacteroidia bacterium]